MNTAPDILEFQGYYRWLSNFWPTPVLFEGVIYPSVEHAYQAAKAHPSARMPFRECTSPGQAKRLGRTIALPDDWEARKVPTMRTLIEQKFSPDSFIAGKLIATGDCQIVEGNTWNDTFWGMCRGKGQNMLGKLIMERRTFLKEVSL